MSLPASLLPAQPLHLAGVPGRRRRAEGDAVWYRDDSSTVVFCRPSSAQATNESVCRRIAHAAGALSAAILCALRPLRSHIIRGSCRRVARLTVLRLARRIVTALKTMTPLRSLNPARFYARPQMLRATVRTWCLHYGRRVPRLGSSIPLGSIRPRTRWRRDYRARRASCTRMQRPQGPWRRGRVPPGAKGGWQEEKLRAEPNLLT